MAALCGATVATAEELRLEPLSERSQPEGTTRFTPLAPERTGIVGINRYDDPRMWGERFREFSLGAVGTGVAIADYDGDGRPDVFVVNKTGTSRLYRNLGDMRFADVTPSAGLEVDGGGAWSTGASWADVDGDGRPDLYVTRFDAPNRLWMNRGDGTFVDEAEARGLAVVDASVHGVFGDYDGDGDLDLFLLTNILNFDVSPTGRADRLLRNDGGRFTDVTRAAGIWGVGQGHAAGWFDADDDGWPDLYVANDFEGPDRFYRNNGDGTFTDGVDVRLPHTTYFSMGLDFGDLNNDGRTDFLVSDMRGRGAFKYLTGIEELARGIWEIERTAALTPQYMRNALYVGTGTPRFLEAAWLADLAATNWTWSVKIADLDQDGREDVFFTTGMVRNFIDADLVDRQNVAPTLEARARVWRESAPLREANLVFKNDGDLRFTESGRAWGLDLLGVSFGAAYADLDGDGDLDMVVANYEDHPTVLRNDSVEGHRVVVALQGQAGNPTGIGARVEIESVQSGRQVRQLFPGRGIVSSDEPVVHFGLGEDTVITRLTVRWPGGAVQTFDDVPANRRIVVRQLREAGGHQSSGAVERAAGAEPWFALTREFGINYRHQELEWDEFSAQPLLPRRLGQQGPGVAVADVNGDGRPDVFVAGGAAAGGALFLSSNDGYDRVAGEWDRSTGAAAAAPLWVDVDGDGALDLMLFFGGVRAEPESDAYRPRVWRGDGRGGFVAWADGAPELRASVGAVTAADFDRDGRVDLFVGSRMVPGRWPESGRSSLVTAGGQGWSDVTASRAPGLAGAGLVTAALWSDVDGDGWLDLLVATEWGPVRLWSNEADASGARQLVERTAEAGLSDVTGWWTALAAIDVDGDGAMDYVAGNTGLNTKYRADAAGPATLWYGDLDGSGAAQVFEAEWEDGALRPLRGRSKVAYAMPQVARRYRSFAEFARAEVTSILGADRLAKARRFEANELRSGVLRNDGRGRFRFEPLPRLAQLAPIQGVVVIDVDGDGIDDVVISQNSFAPEPSTGRFHGGQGLWLRGDGAGGFEPVPADVSGVVIPRDGAGLAAADLDNDGWPDLVAAQNHDELLVLRHRGHDELASVTVELQPSAGMPVGAGARVTVVAADGRRRTVETSTGGALFSQTSASLSVSFSPAERPRLLRVRWPDGRESERPWPDDLTSGRWVVRPD